MEDKKDSPSEKGVSGVTKDKGKEVRKGVFNDRDTPEKTDCSNFFTSGLVVGSGEKTN